MRGISSSIVFVNAISLANIHGDVDSVLVGVSADLNVLIPKALQQRHVEDVTRRKAIREKVPRCIVNAENFQRSHAVLKSFAQFEVKSICCFSSSTCTTGSMVASI